MHNSFLPDSRRGSALRLPLLVVVVVIALLGTTAGIAEAQPPRQTRDEIAADPVPAVEELRLACAPDAIGGQRGILCRWSETQNNMARGYQLYRIVDGSARQLIATVGSDGRRAFFDTDVSAPSNLVYGVVALNRVGRVIGIGGPVHVELGDQVGDLRFGCAARSIDGQRGVLCRWSEAERPVRGYLLYRSVDGAARELIASIPASGRQAFFDTDVVPGAVHTYGVVAVDGDGTVVATGGPQRVQWPDVG